jgi:hypothetical protein
MAYNYKKALEAGYKPEDIINYLSTTRKTKAQDTFRKAGWSDEKIMKSMSKFQPQADITPESLQTKGILGKLGSFFGSEKLGRGLGYRLASKIYPDIEQNLQTAQQAGTMTPEEAQIMRTGGVKPKQMVGSAIETGAWLATPFIPFPKGLGLTAKTAAGATTFAPALTRAAMVGGLAAVSSGGRALANDKTAPQVIKSMAIGGIAGALVSLGIDAVVSGFRWLRSKTPKAFSVTGAAPKGALQRGYERPAEVGAQIEPMADEEAVKQTVLDTQKQIQDYRRTISNQYETQLDAIAVEQKGKLVDLTRNENAWLRNVEEGFPLKSAPGRTNDLSIETVNDLYKELNQLYSKPSAQFNPKYGFLKELRSSLRTSMVKATGGETGSFARLLNDYTTKAQVYSAMDDLFNAWDAGPKAERAATSIFKKIFDENNWAYVDAIADFEKQTGANILDKVAAYQTSQWISPLKGSFSWDELFRWALTPITSPRIAGWTARGMPVAVPGLISKVGQAVAPLAARKYIIPQITSRLMNLE